MNYWLLLEKSDKTRVSKGFDGYQDITGESYYYDSLVPNHKKLASGDSIVLRKDNKILGVGEIAQVLERDDTKSHRRCPECESTDIRERTTKSPRWKCGICTNEFSKPTETNVEIRSYEATIDGFQRLNSPPSIRDVKLCATSGNGLLSQLSILQLNKAKIRALLDDTVPMPSSRDQSLRFNGQGFGLSQAERKSVELYAMRIARDLYELKGWTVSDKSSSHPFDLLAERNHERRFVEVKGTTGRGHAIILTRGEVEHVLNNSKESALVIVSGIVLAKDSNNDEWIASDGEVSTHEDPWTINKEELKATVYNYGVK